MLHWNVTKKENYLDMSHCGNNEKKSVHPNDPAQNCQITNFFFAQKNFHSYLVSWEM